MSQPSRKRGATAPATPSSPKRPRNTAPKTPAVDVLDDVFDVTVEVDESYQVYPEDLCQRVETQCKKLVNLLLTKFKKDSPPHPIYTYSIITRRTSVPPCSTTDYEDHHALTYPAVSLANGEVLKKFLSKVPKKAQLVELHTNQPMSNPEFADHHLVRAEEIGWGFDQYGCLSLQVTTRDTCVRHESIFVVRKSLGPPKVEEVDDDCQVVENPDVEKERGE